MPRHVQMKLTNSCHEALTRTVLVASYYCRQTRDSSARGMKKLKKLN